jgi:DNA mismatch repair protein MutS
MTTAIYEQRLRIKLKHNADVVLFVDYNQHYQAFDEDTKIINKLLELPIEKLNNNVFTELITFDYGMFDTYVPALVKAGYRVAVCELVK